MAQRGGRSRWVASTLLCVVVGTACGGSDDSPPAPLTCETQCEHKATNGCIEDRSQVPFFLENCKAGCASDRQAVVQAQCQSEWDAIYACMGNKVEYGCPASGGWTIESTPPCSDQVLAACRDCMGQYYFPCDNY